MGTITSGIGLVSGINTTEIIDQLLAIEARPRQLVEQRNAVLTSEQVAFQNINAKLLVLKLSANSFVTNRTFSTTSSASSDETVLTASSGTSAVPGTYDFTIDRLVSSQQVITGGFTDQNTTAIASAGGTLTFEFGDARLDTETQLSDLNGGVGVTRGKIQITDRSGTSAVVDLSKALTVDDVLNTINNTSGVSVTASVENDGFKLVDTSGGGGTLSVADVNASGTTATLGLGVAAVGNTLTGSQVNRLGAKTSLSALNDNNGIRIRTGIDDFQITRRDGTTFNVNLDGSTTLDDVINTINTASGGSVTASVDSAGTGLQLIDTSVSNGTILQVTALNSSNAALDLGILTTDGDDDGTLLGSRALSGFNTRLIKSLNGGSGVTTLGTVDITNRTGATTGVDLSSATSVADVISLINNAGAGVTASLNNAGNGLLLTDTTGSTTSNLIVADNTGTAAVDLNLAGSVAATSIDSGNLQLQYISEATRLAALNGGQGIASGKFTITDSNGLTSTVDLTQGETTIQEVINEINSRGLAINAQINNNGDGILIQDTGAGVSALKIEEAGSSTARDLGILGEATTPGSDLVGSFEKTLSIASVQALTGATALSTLNGGDGVNISSGVDDFTIITRDGATHQINLDGSTTITDVINSINTATGGSVTATINALTTGLKITDNTAGVSTFTIATANNSTAATDLGIVASDDDGDGIINGSTIVETTTLQDLVDQVNALGVDVRATIINDGSANTPFRLSLQSTKSGKAGEFIFDDGGLGFGATTLVEAQNAVVFFGSPDPAKGIAITSSTNTLDSVIPSATIDLKSASTSSVQVTITRDDNAIVDAARRFVTDFNSLNDTLTELDSFNAETEERGLLLGDSTIASIRSTLFRLINGRNSDLTSQFRTLAQVGITVGGGSRLQFNETKFRSAFTADSDAVEQLFTFKETSTDATTGEVTLLKGGILPRIDDLLNNLTDPLTGLLQGRVSSIGDQIDLNNSRIEQLNSQLESKRQRLEFQFLSMEKALAQLQAQNSALSGFTAAFNQATSRNQ